MKILIDTNVILDVLMKRTPFFESSAQILRLCENDEIKGYITANTVTDIYYILRKHIDDRAILKDTLIKLLTIIEVADITRKHLKTGCSNHKALLQPVFYTRPLILYLCIL